VVHATAAGSRSAVPPFDCGVTGRLNRDLLRELAEALERGLVGLDESEVGMPGKLWASFGQAERGFGGPSDGLGVAGGLGDADEVEVPAEHLAGPLDLVALDPTVQQVQRLVSRFGTPAVEQDFGEADLDAAGGAAKAGLLVEYPAVEMLGGGSIAAFRPPCRQGSPRPRPSCTGARPGA
jgi:hypothetical protein